MTPHRTNDPKWRNMAPGMPPRLVMLFERRMKTKGETIKDLTEPSRETYVVPMSRFRVHCGLQPAWAKQVAMLNKVNVSRKKRENSGMRRRTQEFCYKGLHRMTGDNLIIINAIGHRRCKICADAASAGRPMPPEKVEEIRAAAVAGATFQQMCNGIPAGGGRRDRSLIITTSKKLQRQRKLDPEFDAFVSKHFKANCFIGQLLRHNKDAPEEVKEMLRLIGKIRHKVKASGAQLPRLHEQRPRRRR